jgi:hypothetical protein
MARARRSSSRAPRKALAVVLGLGGLVALAGCATQGPLLEQFSALRLGTVDSDARVVAAPPPLRTTLVEPAGSTASTSPAETAKASKTAKIVPVSGRPVRSHWCDYLREDTAAQTTIMRSPTLSGSVNDNATASVSLGLSLSSLAKAELMEDAADVRCQKYLAENGLQKLVFVSPQGLTAAGHKAKLKAIEGQKKEIARLRKKVAMALNSGAINRERATAISVLADEILAEAEASRSQADRRLETSLMPSSSAEAYGAALLAAEADLEDINSRMRTFDAFDVSASVGWNDDVNANGFDANDQSFNGKISFSMKLGAALPKRFEHEAAAKDAKLRAIKEEEGGALWQVAVLRRAHERAIEGLVQQRGKLDEAIAKAEELARMLASVDNPDFEPPLIQAKLQLIKLKADRAAVSGSISEIQSNMKKLKAG